MDDFRISTLTNSAVLYLYSERDSIFIEPEYQREGDIWPLEKRQLLIDSIINGYDIPKIYFHEYSPPQKIDGKTYRYAIVDGKQRLTALWDFIDGKFSLSDAFVYLADPDLKLAGMSYVEIAAKNLLIKTRFDSTTLSVVAIQTSDIDRIEDMFSPQ